VNKDKDDISGADVVDGLLWFPFNLIAKSENYRQSLAAADKRIANLQEMQKQNQCKTASKEEQKAAVNKLSSELKELANLYKSGSLTADEYKKAKAKLLNSTQQ